METLADIGVSKLETVDSCSKARVALKRSAFDLVVFNAPLRDETGERLARAVMESTRSQVVFLVHEDHFDAIVKALSAFGILIVTKPLQKNQFVQAFYVAKAAHKRIQSIHREKEEIARKLEDYRLVDRAKRELIARLSMSEAEAHKYIERQAMNMRSSKRTIAENILKMYEMNSF